MTPIDRWRRVGVLGLGASGRAAVRLLRARGAAVTAADEAAVAPDVRAELAGLGASVVSPFQGHFDGVLDGVVVSPGIRADAPCLQALRARGVPVRAELELGWACRGAARVLAVTGSNGKSTLVKLCAEALAQAGLRAVAAGNYGLPVCEAVRQGGWDWLVIEASTFQLETVDAFRPEIGILLNVHPNHLDRHGSMAIYAGLKARLFARMTAADTALLHDGAENGVPVRADGPKRRLFGTTARAWYRYADGVVQGGATPVPVRGTRFDNPILGVAAAAAAGAMDAAGVPVEALVRALAAFQPLPHRMQWIRRIGGVDFIDDSKATNLAALAAALAAVPGPVRLIAGGLLKETELEAVKEVLAKKCKKVYGIGKSSPLLEAAWRDRVSFENCGVLADAVRKAWRDASAGETVLLSAGCASFDQFRGYADRGEQFTCIVQALETEKERP